jgi:hypothetical protein
MNHSFWSKVPPMALQKFENFLGFSQILMSKNPSTYTIVRWFTDHLISFAIFIHTSKYWNIQSSSKCKMSQVEEFCFHPSEFVYQNYVFQKQRNWDKCKLIQISNKSFKSHRNFELGNLQYQKFKTQFDTYSKFTASSSRQLPSRVYYYSSLMGFEWIETKQISSWNIKFRFNCKMKTSHSRKQQMKKGL